MFRDHFLFPHSLLLLGSMLHDREGVTGLGFPKGGGGKWEEMEEMKGKERLVELLERKEGRTRHLGIITYTHRPITHQTHASSSSFILRTSLLTPHDSSPSLPRVKIEKCHERVDEREWSGGRKNEEVRWRVNGESYKRVEIQGGKFIGEWTRVRISSPLHSTHFYYSSFLHQSRNRSL